MTKITSKYLKMILLCIYILKKAVKERKITTFHVKYTFQKTKPLT